MKDGLSFGKGILWTLAWFGFMLLYTAIDVVILRTAAPDCGKYLNLISIILCMLLFIYLLTKKNNFKIRLLEGISVRGILLAAGCSVLFYFLLDKGLDPVFESFFPESEENYQEMLKSLSEAPIASFIQVCILAPIIEEILMRGFLLDGFAKSYGTQIALIASSLLFALLHFNMVQTLSAFICGMVLGVLYLHTGSVFCCILAHMGYNLISWLMMLGNIF